MIIQIPLHREYRPNEYLFQFRKEIENEYLRNYCFSILKNGLAPQYHDETLSTCSLLVSKTPQTQEFNKKFLTQNIDINSLSYLTSVSGARGFHWIRKSIYNGEKRSVFIRYNSTASHVLPKKDNPDKSPDERRMWRSCQVKNIGLDTIIEIYSPENLSDIIGDSLFRKHFDSLPDLFQSSNISLNTAKSITVVHDPRQYHLNTQIFLLNNSPIVCACELPVSGRWGGEKITTFIDIVAEDWETGGFFLLDYKPNAMNEKYVLQQLLASKALFCQSSGIAKNMVRVGWFDEMYGFLVEGDVRTEFSECQ